MSQHLNDVSFSTDADPPQPGDPGQVARPGGQLRNQAIWTQRGLKQWLSSLGSSSVGPPHGLLDNSNIMLASHEEGRIIMSHHFMGVVSISSASSRAKSCLWFREPQWHLPQDCEPRTGTILG